MAENLQVEQPLSATAQPVKDAHGNTSALALSTAAVGIGTLAPQRTLHIVNGGICLEPGALPPGLFGWQVAPGGSGDNSFLGFHEDTLPNHNGSWRVVINKGGNVGIGTTNPQEKLEVNGTIVATRDIRLAGADCAEEFDIVEGQALESGTVMVIGDEEQLHQCAEAYDRRVAGVLSGAGNCQPGIILGRLSSPNTRRPLALTGKVYCKVDAHYAPIGVGDLLTTSSTPGHAMRASDPVRAFGAILGKALRPLTQGRGLIPILVALQ